MMMMFRTITTATAAIVVMGASISIGVTVIITTTAGNIGVVVTRTRIGVETNVIGGGTTITTANQRKKNLSYLLGRRRHK